MFNANKKKNSNIKSNIKYVDLKAIPEAHAVFEHTIFKSFWTARHHQLTKYFKKIPVYKNPLSLSYQQLNKKSIEYAVLKGLMFFVIYLLAIAIQILSTYNDNVTATLLTKKPMLGYLLPINILHQASFFLFTGFLLITMTYIILKTCVLKKSPKKLLTIGWWFFTAAIGISKTTNSTVIQYINENQIYGKRTIILPTTETQTIAYLLMAVIIYYIFKNKAKIYTTLKKIYVEHQH